MFYKSVTKVLRHFSAPVAGKPPKPAFYLTQNRRSSMIKKQAGHAARLPAIVTAIKEQAMQKANIKLLAALAGLIVLVAAAGLLFGGGLQLPDSGRGPITITATEGLIIPGEGAGTAYGLPADTAWLSVRADGFTYAPVPLVCEGDYTFTQPDGGYNTLHVTKSSIRMHSADCVTQDCVTQGTASLENLDFRALGGQIICLPHKLIVELLPPGGQSSVIVLEEAQQ